MRRVQDVSRQIGEPLLIWLRFETEDTLWPGTTVVSRAERRHFRRGLTLAPWCANRSPSKEAPRKRNVKKTASEISVSGSDYRPKCPACGADGRCNGNDVGGIDYYDYFLFWCDSCGHVQASGLSGGTPLADSDTNKCPYCGIRATQHGSSPPNDVKRLATGYAEGILRRR